MKRRALFFFLTVVLALCVAYGVWLYRERRQYALNRQLITALEHNDAKTALALVKAGADLNTRQVPPPAPTLPELLKHLLHPTPSVNDSPTAFRMAFGGYWSTAPNQSFQLISLDKNLPLIQAILAHGVNVNARDSSGLTVLHDAVTYEQLHTVELLLQHGADINVQATDGRSPLFLAVGNWKPDITRLLLSHGANPNIQDADGRTALYWAVVAQSTNDRISDFLAYRADPNLPNKKGETPLMLAQKMQRPDLVRLLQQHGAK